MIRKLLVTSIILYLGMTICAAQTQAEHQEISNSYNQNVLSALEIEFRQNFEQEQQQAFMAAAENGWQTNFELPGGGNALLVGLFPDGSPKYYVTDNVEAAITTRTNLLHTGGSLGLNLNGENMIAGIWDSGLIRTTHDIFNNRVQQIDNSSNITIHGTHVAGTIIGNGDVNSGTVKGMAHLASLIAYDFSNDEAEMTTEAANGLLIANLSYGIGASNAPLWYLGFYDSNARDLDRIVYNAPYFLPVSSAGNDRQTGINPNDGGYDYLTDKSVAKNNIVVTGVNEVLSYTGPNDVVMPNFSSWGPTDDGRIKPDISAKGVNMTSSGGSADDTYITLNGTSMSTANVSGSLLLLQQYYNEINSNYMLASTLRALVLNTADEAGDAPGPDYKFGWGLMNMEKAANIITNNGTTALIMEAELSNNETYSLPLLVENLNEDVIATIAWTDPEGVVLASGNNDVTTASLQNDLDIVITNNATGETFSPWKLDVNNPTAPATKGINNVDNIETIQFTPTTAGAYTLTVTHKENSLQDDLQAFSIVLSNRNTTLNISEDTIQGLKLFPNPTSTILTISASVNLNTIVVLTVLGEQVKKVYLNGNTETIDISGLAAGIYFVEISSSDTSIMKQIIKK